MTHYIAHRINTIEELKALPQEFGVELDLRDYGDHLILQHDPFVKGVRFDEYLKHYQHGTMILNIKSERIEQHALELLRKFNIIDYFFLDSSFPMIYQLSKQGETRCAIRFSEFEGMDTVLKMKDKVEWVWVDCFSRLPITKENYQTLKSSGFKLCLVSPELQSREKDIEQYKEQLLDAGIIFDAICTKSYNIERWKCID